MAVALARRPAGTGAATALVAALAGVGWLVLVLWDRSPWGRYLHHDELAEGSLAPPVALGVFALGWLLMLAAMMLPTTHRLVALFGRLVAGRPDRRRLLAHLLAGYAAVWLAAGFVAYLGDQLVHLLLAAAPALEERAGFLAATVLAGAAAYEVSPLKERCLTRCRDPRAELVRGWHGGRPATEAFAIGSRHGATCVACCWALMLVMFAIGAGSFALMLLLGAAMATEKLAPWGHRIRRPLGAGLAAAAISVVALSA